MDELGEIRRKANLRLECLRLANAKVPSGDVVAVAGLYADFVLGAERVRWSAIGSLSDWPLTASDKPGRRRRFLDALAASDYERKLWQAAHDLAMAAVGGPPTAGPLTQLLFDAALDFAVSREAVPEPAGTDQSHD